MNTREKTIEEMTLMEVVAKRMKLVNDEWGVADQSGKIKVDYVKHLNNPREHAWYLDVVMPYNVAIVHKANDLLQAAGERPILSFGEVLSDLARFEKLEKEALNNKPGEPGRD